MSTEALRGQGVQIGDNNIQVNKFYTLSTVPVDVAAKDPDSVYTAVDVGAFTGREWLTSRVDEFLAAHPCGYLFVVAEAGLGKTAFAAWLVRTRGYLSHFSRYAGGRSVRTALQNLSAQLVREFNLDELAPGGMLPDWAQTPAGFEKILGLSAVRAREDGRQLVLVVDGLDEAEPCSDGLAFGLPPMLPEGAYVVATYRTGLSPGRPESPAVVIPISKADPRNADDIRAYVARAVGEKILAARLAEAGTDPAEFTGQLTQRSGGIWVYVRYILQEVRLGLRAPDAIESLPAGLLGYYAGQIRRWKQDPAWNHTLLPLLATVGVAGEPLPVTMLAHLAGGLDVASVRQWCELTARPLLTASRPGPGDGPLRYEIYHASFREALTAWPADHAPEPDGVSQEFDPLADELQPAIRGAHSRIADCYLSRFGGIDDALPALAAAPELGGMDRGYALRWLPWHLLSVDRADDLHRLLALSPQGRNVWFRAHDHSGDLAGYLDDIASARSSASRLAPQLRYSIVEASIASLATMLGPVLLGELVGRGLWTPSRALNYVERMADEPRQAQALARIAATLPSDLVGEALSLALRFQQAENRAAALEALIPHVPDHILEQRLDRLIGGVADCYRNACYGPLVALANRLPGEILDDLQMRMEVSDALASAVVTFFRGADRAQSARDALAIAVEDDKSYGGADTLLASLLPHVPPEAFDDVFAAMRTISLDDVEFLRCLARHAPAERLTDILDMTKGHWHLYNFVDDIVPRLSEIPLATAMDLCRSVTEDHSRAVMIKALIPRLSADESRRLLASALGYSDSFTVSDLLELRYLNKTDPIVGLLLDRLPEEEARALVRDRVLRHLPGSGPIELEHMPAYAVAARHISVEARRAVLHEIALCLSISKWDAEQTTPFLRRFAPLSGEEVDTVFDLLERAQPMTWWPSSGLWLADFLAPDAHDEVLEKIRERVATFPIEESCFTAIAALGQYQEPATRNQTAKRALALAATIANPSRKAQAIAELSPILNSDELATRAFGMLEGVGLYAGVRAKDRLAGALSVPQLRAVIDEACCFDASVAILQVPQTLTRLSALGFSDVIDRVLPGASEREKVLRVAPSLTASQADRIWRSRREALTQDEATSLAALVGCFPEEERGGRADEILSDYPILSDYRGPFVTDKDARILGELARATSTERLTRTIRDLLAPARSLADPILRELAPHLPESFMEDAFRYALSVSDHWRSCLEIAALAPRLPVPLVDLAVAHVFGAECERHIKARAATALALQLRDDRVKRDRLVTIALDEGPELDVLAELIPHLPTRLRPRAVDRAVNGLCAQWRSQVPLDPAHLDTLRELLAALRGPELEDLYKRLGEQIRNPRVRAQVQAAVLQRSGDEHNPELFTGRQTLHSNWPGAFDRAALMSLLAAAAWWIEAHSNTGVDEVVESIFDAATWWP